MTKKAREQATERQGTTEGHIDKSKLASPPPTPRKEETAKDPGTYWDTEYETSAFDRLGKGDMTDEDKLVADEIREIARTELNTSNKKSENGINDGQVYVYKVPGNETLVKIGFTTASVAVRLEDWKKTCQREPTVLYPPADGLPVPEPHAHRIERLVHAELMEHRVRHYCERCCESA